MLHQDQNQVVLVRRNRQLQIIFSSAQSFIAMWTLFIVNVNRLLIKKKDPSKRLGLESRPFAVGQAHIIVTCNYMARSSGIKKLMSKEAALRILPSLIIVDGSDLTLYRRQSRRIYLCFREALSKHRLNQDQDIDEDKVLAVKACKGEMDEMFADLTCHVSKLLPKDNDERTSSLVDESVCFVYGSQGSDISVSEDQSGATSRISLHCGARNVSDGVPGCSYNDVSDWGDEVDRMACAKRLHGATLICQHIKQEIKTKTGFNVCIGISISPMLAKIASDLQVMKFSLSLFV